MTAIRAKLSYARSIVGQQFDRLGREPRWRSSPWSARFRRLPVRQPQGSSPVPDWVRPIGFPQIGVGGAEVRSLPDAATPGLAVTSTALRRRRVVRVADEVVDRQPDELLLLAAVGVPLVRCSSDRQTTDGFWKLLDVAAPTTRRERELQSVRLRRAALDQVVGPPVDEVTVLLASRRPDEVVRACSRIARQEHDRIHVVVGLHGDEWADDVERRIDTVLDGRSTVRRFGSSVIFGEVLADMTSLASTDLVTKWDDDDLYGIDHIGDLLRAYRYSGADVVGKGSEFVHLETSDETIRRFSVGAEEYSPILAGGTLLTSQGWLDRVGGWPRTPNRVDSGLIRATRSAGGSTYRTHGFQYVLRRRGSAHTWDSDDSHFKASATERRPGLDLAFADIEPSAADQSATSSADS